ncbi:MAG: hypothetical protein ACI9MR_002796, partial [Myxococcota bacterium]
GFGTASFVTGAFGLLAAGTVINQLANPPVTLPQHDSAPTDQPDAGK